MRNVNLHAQGAYNANLDFGIVDKLLGAEILLDISGHKDVNES